MTRILSALVLLPIVVAIVWLAPPVATLVLVEIVVAFACVEYVGLMKQYGRRVSAMIVIVAALTTCAAQVQGSAELVLMAAVLACTAAVVGAERPGADALSDVALALFAPLYLALPLGALIELRFTEGAGVVLLLLGTVIASDTAQYYGGRMFGRRFLAPVISPKKTVEGALFGLLTGTVALVVGGHWVLVGAPPLALALVGVTVAAAGIMGDLFESVIKRGVGVKDASGLIPGHGGMLDRIDSLLFAAPVYYVAVTYAL